jgi:S1-C subfamily serine protease
VHNLTELSNELAIAVEGAGQSVVAVYGGGRSPSSGVHWKPGVIVTAEHSLRREEEITLGLPDGTTRAAELAGRDPGTDLAALRFDAGSMPVLAAGGAPKTGEIVVAVGRHRDIGVCAAMGIVSVIGPPWNTWRGGRLESFIRLDLSLYAGCSGAAIVDVRGRAIGIATAALSRIAPVAIPSTAVDRIANELVNRGYLARGYLGVGLQPVALPQDLGAAGLIVLSVEKGSPAAKAGLMIGDIVTALDHQPVADTRDVQGFLASENIGKSVPVSIIRAGRPLELVLTIGEKGK